MFSVIAMRGRVAGGQPALADFRGLRTAAFLFRPLMRTETVSCVPGGRFVSSGQEQKGTPTVLVFGAAALFVFLVLAAKYESWKVPLAVVLIVPMCLLASVTGLLFRGMSIDILAQIGFVVLVGLAAKNAILIVEFARRHQAEGSTPAEAAIHAARTRLRPILMTSLAFILGVTPLVVATGAGAEMRQSLGTAVFGGMLGVTAFGLIFTPAFYTIVQRTGLTRRQDQGALNNRPRAASPAASPHAR
jgi:multidrug efflux pump subunit AcrB